MGAHVDRAFLSLGSRPVLAYAMLAFERCPDIDLVVLVVRREQVDAARSVASMFGCSKAKTVVAGAAQRQGSVQAGLDALPEDVKLVAVHDASRPLVTPALISETLKSAKRYGSGVAALRVENSIKEVEKGLVVTRTVGRAKLWHAITPQSFKRELLVKGLALAKEKGLSVEDDAHAVSLVESVHLVTTEQQDIRIASADDLTLAAAVLRT